MANVFISYARTDWGRVAGILNGLRAAHIDFFYDRSIDASESWEHRLDSGLAKSSKVLAVWSRISVGREQVLRELEVATKLGLEIVQVVSDRSLHIPLPYGAGNAADLTRWTGSDFADLHWSQVIERLGGRKVPARALEMKLATANDHDKNVRRSFPDMASMSGEVRKLLNSGFVISSVAEDRIALKSSAARKHAVMEFVFKRLFGKDARLYSNDRLSDPVLQVCELTRPGVDFESSGTDASVGVAVSNSETSR